MNTQQTIGWKWGAFAAAAIVILSLYPQLTFWAQRGRSWNGAYAYVDTDEVAYAAYTQALIDGRPRKNDPYTGRDHLQNGPLPESLFSVQCFPPYVTAIVARILGLNSSSSFILMMPFSAILSSLVLFWFLARITDDSKLAAVGVLVVLCLSTLVSGQGPSRLLFGTPVRWNYLPFLRRYIPGLVFPLFLALFALNWRIIKTQVRSWTLLSVVSGLIIGLLVFSYFYLWTAAIAWICCLAFLFLLARPNRWKQILQSLSLSLVIALPFLFTYLYLLSQRSNDMDQAQALSLSHRPDLFRPSEVMAIVILALLSFAISRRRLSLKEPQLLFAISLLLLPVAVFNQQIITGRSLQPFHYEEFVTGYCVLMALLITAKLCVRLGLTPSWLLSSRALFWVGILSFTYGINSAAQISLGAYGDNIVRDQSAAVGRHMNALPNQDGRLVFNLEPRQAESWPGLARQPVLWALHMGVFPGLGREEFKERFYQYLYYSGTSAAELRNLLEGKSFAALTALFGPSREAAHLTASYTPVTKQEVDDEISRYAEYVNAFNRQTASKFLLGYCIVPADGNFDSSNLDRWYERESEQRIGEFVVYELKLR